MKRRVRELIGRARNELAQAEQELMNMVDNDEDMDRGLNCDADLIEIRARVDSLEARVSVIERQ